MPLNTKMELHDTPTSKLAEIKAISPMILNDDNKYTASEICKMIEFRVDNIYARFGGQLFRQTVGTPMGANCAPLFAELFLYSYENEFLDKLVKVDRESCCCAFLLRIKIVLLLLLVYCPAFSFMS